MCNTLNSQANENGIIFGECSSTQSGQILAYVHSFDTNEDSSDYILYFNPPILTFTPEPTPTNTPMSTSSPKPLLTNTPTSTLSPSQPLSPKEQQPLPSIEVSLHQSEINNKDGKNSFIANGFNILLKLIQRILYLFH